LHFFLEATNSSLENIYSYKLLPNGTAGWVVNSDSYLESLLNNYNNTIKTGPTVGSYKEINRNIYLFDNYAYGKEIDINKSITAFKQWSKPGDQFIIMKSTKETTFNGKNVYDFSNIIAKGQTRIKLVVDGKSNPSLINAQGGLNIIDDIIVKPYEQFSYIEVINKKQAETSNQYDIGYGTCNSTTTLFRAALEAGFPIDERHNHSFVVDSYAWGYPYNFVDAAYFPSPKVDFKFTNDLGYPILLNFKIYKDSTYQYHVIEIRSSQYVPQRSIQLINWVYIKKYSDNAYTGEFTRIVNDQNNNPIRKDTFRSSYH